MSYIAQPADERPRYQIVSLEHGYTVAICESQHWAEFFATLANENETRKKLIERNREVQMDDRTMEP